MAEHSPWNVIWCDTGCSEWGWPFYWQNQQRDRDRQNKLLSVLGAELHTSLNILRSESQTKIGVQDPASGEGVMLDESILVTLQLRSVEEAIRSGVFDIDDTLLLVNLANHVDTHNKEVDFLLSIRGGSGNITSIISAQKELEERQARIADWCEKLLDHLHNAEGITVPSVTGQDTPGKAHNSF